MRIPISGQPIRLPILLLAAIEAMASFASPYVAVWIRFSGHDAYTATHGPLWPRGICFAAVMLVSLIATGLYSERQRARAMGVLLRVMASAAASFATLALFFYIEPSLLMGRGVLGITVAVGMCACLMVRAVAARLIDESLFKRRVVVYGAGTRASVFARLRRRADQRGFTIVGFIAPPSQVIMMPGDRLLPYEADLLGLCRRLDVDEIVVAMDDRRVAFPVESLLHCRLSGIEVIDLQSFLERETGKLRLDVIDPSWMIFGPGFRCKPLRVLSERLLDLLACAVLLGLTWPVMLLVVVAIKIEDGTLAPIHYRQRRVGLGGIEFEMLKFRTMREDAEQAGSAQWAAEDDPRVTRVGGLIRRLHIDELPQIFNVLKGDMNIVGPRPERPEFVRELSEKIPYYRERHFVKPGITGWAQLCFAYGASESDALEKLQYDLYYVKNHCLLFDLSILLQTAEVVLWRKGAR
jgi:sugar transferase (PEP-CTERM system associated)